MANISIFHDNLFLSLIFEKYDSSLPPVDVELLNLANNVIT